MLSTPQRLRASGGDTYGFALLAGRSRDTKQVQILIDNYQIPTNPTPPVFRMMQKMKEQGITMEMPTTFDLSKLKSLPKRTDI
jgi:hypothetical protein